MLTEAAKVTKMSLGPQALAGASGDPFLLSREEWIKVQVYVAQAMMLPATRSAMQIHLNADNATLDEIGVNDLVAAYAAIGEHCKFWRDRAFPTTVSLADDIVHYGSKARVYYQPLNDIAAKWEDGSDPEPADRKRFGAILDALAKEADKFAANAAQAAQNVSRFAKLTADDRDSLSRQQTAFRAKFSSADGYVRKLNQNLADARKALRETTDEYNHDVTVAATTPTYAWFPPPPLPPFGLIPAAIVAGIYGDRAVKAKQKIERTNEDIATLNSQIQKAVKVLQGVDDAREQLEETAKTLQSALAVIQKIEGVWSAISADLKNLRTLITQDIREAMPILATLGIQEAIEQWARLADMANKYRVNAFVEIPAVAKAA